MTDRMLVTDFDGTMTRRDFYQTAIARLPDSAAGYWHRYEAGELTHFAALAAIFAELRVSEAEFVNMLQEMEFEPGVAAAVEGLRRAGWEVAVASAGCGLYIGQLLAGKGLDLAVHANPGRFSPEEGLVMELPRQSPYFSPSTGIDKGAIVRGFLLQGMDVAYAGDGRPDLEPLLLLPGDRRFARGWLAMELEARKEPFTRFEKWPDIAAELLKGG